MDLIRLPQIAAHFLGARRRWQRLRGNALTTFQEHRARRIVAFAAEHAPTYRDHWAGHDLAEWRSLPTMTKAIMMAGFDGFNTRGIRRDDALARALRAEEDRDFRPMIAGMTVGLSSGTSGHRGLFLVSPAEQAAWAGTILARTIHTPRSRLRVAFFLRANSNLYEATDGILIRFQFFDLMTPIAEAVARLNVLAPEIVVGPPSLLSMLAQASHRGVLTIRPERLIAVAEVLEPQDADSISAAFNAPVQQIYQCTEGLLAISCAHGRLHIQEDLVALQCLPYDAGNATDRVTPIVTDLWRRTQPIIRYRLNDLLRLARDPCPCGSPWRVIAAIEGRADDCCVFLLENGAERIVFPDIIRRMILLASPSISDYQAIQEAPGQLRIHITLIPGAEFGEVSTAIRDRATAILASYGCRPPSPLTIVEGLEVRPMLTKRRRVQCVTPGCPPTKRG